MHIIRSCRVDNSNGGWYPIGRTHGCNLPVHLRPKPSRQTPLARTTRTARSPRRVGRPRGSRQRLHTNLSVVVHAKGPRVKIPRVGGLTKNLVVRIPTDGYVDQTMNRVLARVFQCDDASVVKKSSEINAILILERGVVRSRDSHTRLLQSKAMRIHRRIRKQSGWNDSFMDAQILTMMYPSKLSMQGVYENRNQKLAWSNDNDPDRVPDKISDGNGRRIRQFGNHGGNP